MIQLDHLAQDDLMRNFVDSQHRSTGFGAKEIRSEQLLIKLFTPLRRNVADNAEHLHRLHPRHMFKVERQSRVHHQPRAAILVEAQRRPQSHALPQALQQLFCIHLSFP
ncbi:hypothetical protein SDC9_79919 [bioreactor metagenome]|uniref:Uncharacterized protein n=1 Tax=bioreactor metagenome TaxID=1076179 RepID=A0A644YXS7_9ZZZZ